MLLQIVLGVAAVIALLLAVGWAGLQVKPASFPAFPQASQKPETISLPDGLPAPVERFYRQIYGDSIPVIKTAVFSGRAEMRPFGPAMPARFRFTHVAGQDYRHYIEATWFGLPIMQVNERYVGGKARMEVPFATDEGDKLDQAANLGMWAELAWVPAVFLTDSRVRWEAVDENTAVLLVPFKQAQERYVVRFDPKTGLVDWMESMRYHDSKSASKVLWLNQSLEWKPIDGVLTNVSGSATWMDNGKPWAVFHVEDIHLNLDVQEYINRRGL